MSTQSPDPGLSAACRAFLREGMPEGAAWSEHLEGCSFCAARATARRRFADVLREPAAPPAALHAPAFLDAIRTRIVEQCEQASLGSLLEKGMPVEPPGFVREAFPAGLLAAEVARDVLAARQPAAGGDWATVRTRVLDDLAAHRRRRVARAKGVALVGVAAAAIFCGIFFTEGTQTPPTIVITDISAMPAVDFSPMAVLRHGTDH